MAHGPRECAGQAVDGAEGEVIKRAEGRLEQRELAPRGGLLLPQLQKQQKRAARLEARPSSFVRGGCCGAGEQPQRVEFQLNRLACCRAASSGVRLEAEGFSSMALIGVPIFRLQGRAPETQAGRGSSFRGLKGAADAQRRFRAWLKGGRRRGLQDWLCQL